MPSPRKTESPGSTSPYPAVARHDELSGWTRIKVALAWPLEFWLKLKTKKPLDFLRRLIGRLSGRLKKWNAGQLRRTEEKLGK